MTDDHRHRAIALHDRFTHGHGDRRAFMRDLAALAGGATAAAALAASIGASPASAALVAADDPRLTAETVTFPGAGGHRMSGLLVRPKGSKARLPGVIVIHENRGLVPHIQDVARRVALAGFVALAPDFLAPAGGTPADEDQGRTMIGGLDPAATVADAVATLAWLRRDGRTTGKVGAVGFCWGGGMVDKLAVAAGPALGAGVAFYGPPPPRSEAAKVKAPLMLHYAGLDERINAAAGPWVEALKAARVDVTRYDYPGVNHAFHNDTSAARYDKAAATLAWDRTIAFFREKLA